MKRIFVTLFLAGSLLAACCRGQNESAEPEFSGPWAAELEQTYQRTTADFAKKVLAKGTITDKDMAEAQQSVRQCMEDEGFTDITFNSDGSSSVADPQNREQSKTESARTKCMAQVGYEDLEEVYYPMKINPENLDFATIIVDCLKDKGAVQQSFTVQDFDLMFQNDQEIPINQDILKECNTDPLGLNQ